LPFRPVRTGGPPQTESGRPRPLSVAELTAHLKTALEGRFVSVWVRGEISNLKTASSGHLYFTLKDAGACLAAVMFRSDLGRTRFQPRDGLGVLAHGRVTVYEARGQYQLVCDALEPAGAGALALAFEQLKARLAAEGLFASARKRPVPFLPRRIGLVTSPSGAAVHDFLRVLQDRFPIPVLIAPVRVQGQGAGLEIASALRRLSASGQVDVIVLARGGGSLEDLWAFNEEPVARAIAASRVPVVSAVGHETDVTIADFVADRRCATPTDAAKTLAPPREELARDLALRRRHLAQLLLRQLGERRQRLRLHLARLADPRRALATRRLELDDRADQLQAELRRRVAGGRARVRELSERLSREHPQSRLLRLSRRVAELKHALALAEQNRLSDERARLAGLSERLRGCEPTPGLVRRRERLARARERAERALARRWSEERVRWSRAGARLESLSPLAVLGRGYAIAFDEGRHVVRSAVGLQPGQPLRVLLPDRVEIAVRVERMGEGLREGGESTTVPVGTEEG